jgi:calcineurin-like phosphoesterase family protein
MVVAFGRRSRFSIDRCRRAPPERSGELARFRRNIHGHIHANSVGDKSYINVSAEKIHLAPIALEELRL